MNLPGPQRGESITSSGRARAGSGAAGAGGALALLVVLAGCSSPLWRSSSWGPLGEAPGDLAPRAREERLRRVDALILERFTSSTTPPPNAASGSATPPSVPTAPTSAMIVEPGAAMPSAESVRLRYAGVERVSVSLAQARASALENNLDLRVAVVDPRIATESEAVERAKFDAVFTPSATFSSVDTPGLPGSFEGQQDQFSAGAGVSVPLRTGGRASVNLTQNVSGGDSPLLSADPIYASALTFSIAQPLLRGAGREVNVASIRIAGLNQQIAEARTKLSVVTQLANVERAYWRVFAARRELDVRQQQYDLAQAQLERARRRVRGGDASEVEVTRAESGLAERLEAIIIAETNVLTTQRELKRIANIPGLDVSTTVYVETQTQPEPREFELDTARLLALARESRMELLETELAILADTLNIDVARNQVLPQLDIVGSYGVQGIGTGFGSNVRRAGNADFQNYSVGVQGSIPLGNEAAEAGERRAVFVRVQRLATRQARLQVVEQDVLDAVDRVRSTWQRIMASRQATILAARTLQGEQRQFEVGRRTSTDVLDAAARLADSQSAEIRALTDYQIAQVDLAVATGTVLGQSNVSWSPEPATEGPEATTPPATTPAPAPSAPTP
jgi:outer membrane protein